MEAGDFRDCPGEGGYPGIVRFQNFYWVQTKTTKLDDHLGPTMTNVTPNACRCVLLWCAGYFARGGLRISYV